MMVSHSDNFERVAQKYLSLGIQSWGQADAVRKQATDEYLAAAGFQADDPKAKEWLNGVLNQMEWGKCEREVGQLVAALKSRPQSSGRGE